MAAGKGVDMIVDPGKPLPFKDNTFDLVLATSVFEHDPAFWMTFLELSRVLKDGGHFYMNAPSNGQVHRYPEDHWRFYPDCGAALERWAASQEVSMLLIESFIAPRKGDMWNDFVAVFRKGAAAGSLSGRFLHTHFHGINVYTMGATQLLRERKNTQDMDLIEAAQERACRLEAQLAEERAKSTDAAAERSLIENRLRQREEEIAQTRQELERVLGEGYGLEALERKLADANAWVFRLSEDREAAERKVASLTRSIARLQKELHLVRHELNQSRQGKATVQQKLNEARCRIDERFEELATVSKLLRTAEREVEKENERRAWMTEVLMQLSTRPAWWSFLPRKWQQKRQLDRIERRGLFSGSSYLQRYPDVAQEGMNPLMHFIVHGMDEGRDLPR